MMAKTTTVLAMAAACFLAAGPVMAQSSDASSDSMRGAGSGAAKETTNSVRTGADTGSGAMPSNAAKDKTGTGDNAVLNAPREAIPGSKGTSQPSNLNGQ